MTDQTKTAQPVLTDDEIQDIADGFDIYGAKPEFARAIESVLLSKLRAEGVQAGDEREAFEAAEREINSRVDLSVEWRTEEYANPWVMDRWRTWRRAWKARVALASAPVADAVQWPTMPESKGQSPVLFEDGYAEGWAKCMDECRRAVSAASAPVAGEAQPAAWLYRECRFPSRHGYEYRDVLSATLLDHYYTGRDETYVKGEPLYAAPQASEAVRMGEDAKRWRWATASDENAQGLYTIVQCYGGDQQKINERADFYRAGQADKDGGDCAKGAGNAAMRNALIAFDEAMNLCGDFPELQHHRDALLFAVQKARAALSPTPSVVKQSLTATQTGEKGESE